VAIYFNDLVSGNGMSILSGSQVQYVLSFVDTAGSDIFAEDTGNPDSVIRIGWISLGAMETYPGSEGRVFWTERIWLNFLANQWHPRPSNHPGDSPDFTVWASHIRWALSPGTGLNLLVVGI
jgi:hypothetical protein